jgi:hypothetical protein
MQRKKEDGEKRKGINVNYILKGVEIKAKRSIRVKYRHIVRARKIPIWDGEWRIEIRVFVSVSVHCRPLQTKLSQ